MDHFQFMILNWYSDDTLSDPDGGSCDESIGSDDDDTENKFEVINDKYHIYLFGVDREGKNVCIDVQNFTPFFYLKIPRHWTNGKIKSFIEECRVALGKKRRDNLLGFKIMFRKDGYGFTNNREFKFIQLRFQNYGAYRSLKWKIKNRDKCFSSNLVELYNSNVDPILSFMHAMDLLASGWVSIDKKNLKHSRTARTDFNYSVTWSKIKPLDHQEVPPLKILSFDIECFSQNGDFPNPKKPEDKIIQIGSTIQRYGSCGAYEGAAKGKQNVVVLGACDDIPGVEVAVCNTEKQLLSKWFNFVIRENPDVIIGYNIDGFDWSYIAARCDFLECEYFNHLSRLKHVYSKYEADEVESKAFGANQFNLITTPGILQIDLLHYFRKECKLESYKLDFVAKHFLNQQKRDVTPQEIFRMGGPFGSPGDRAIVAEYCAQDTLLPIRLLENRLILENLIEMSKCVSVPIPWLLRRGQQIKVYSQLQREFRNKGYLFPEELKFHRETGEKYEGATVLNCERGIHIDDPVGGLDFASLYPSIIIAHNLCITTLVFEDKYKNLPGVDYERYTWENGDHTFSKVPGVVPEIMERLWNERKTVKRQMKDPRYKGIKAVLNAKQLAIKVSMNSIYGVFGASRGYVCARPIASTITYTGRKMIEHSKKCAETFYDGTPESNGVKAHVVYGDSVTGDMPVTIKVKNKWIYPRRIDSLNHSNWFAYPGRTEHGDSKEQSIISNDVEVWTANGWAKGVRMIRHKIPVRIRNDETNVKIKRLYRVVTQRGIVHCTEDHSLIEKESLKTICVSDIIKEFEKDKLKKIELLHRIVPNIKKMNNTMNANTERKKYHFHAFN